MIYTTHYNSPIGKKVLASEDNKLIGLWIEGQKHYLGKIKDKTAENNNIPIFKKTKSWLNKYFEGENPKITELELAPIGSEFSKIVWKTLCEIPYGEVTTYGNIAKKVAKQMHKEKMSSQAIGGRIANNPISIIIPCHRVVGTNGNLTGYASGIDKKIKLLELEKIETSKLKLPKR